jgi:hypothetical protein
MVILRARENKVALLVILYVSQWPAAYKGNGSHVSTDARDTKTTTEGRPRAHQGPRVTQATPPPVPYERGYLTSEAVEKPGSLIGGA